MKQRVAEIDYLRGIAMFGMILIHTSYYFLSDKIALFLWNWSQFAVPVFIFCSGFLFFKKSAVSYDFNYFKKRFIRLLIPFYIFLPFFLVAVFFREPSKLSFNYVFSSILTIGGVDITWLVLLFLQFAILMPIIQVIFNKNKSTFFSILTISFISSIIFLNQHLNISYKFYMCLPWLLIVFYSFFFVKYSERKKFSIYIILSSLFIFLISGIFLKSQLHSLSFYDNKYPPNIFILSYGILFTQILYSLSKSGLFNFIKRPLLFLSKYSYSIFFIHYLLLYILVGFLKVFKFNWFSFFAVVFLSALIIQSLINKAVRRLSY
jgi:peptidoglycan/LPS O-acetylase OafA/YrhL